MQISLNYEDGRMEDISEQEIEVAAGYYIKNFWFMIFRTMERRSFEVAFILTIAVLRKLFRLYPYYSKAERDVITHTLIYREDPSGITIHDGNNIMRFECSFLYDLNLMAVLVVEIVASNQYNLTDENTKGKVFIDAGANIGVFSIYAAMRGAKKVYAFEPSGVNFNIMKRNIERSGLGKIIVPINKGLGNKNKKMPLHCDFKNMCWSSISNPSKGCSIVEDITITTLDSFMQGKRDTIGFIKMDTEGYEENILLGAKRTIQKDEPVLSFSAYHKPDDKTRLPEVLHEIDEKYSCRLLHRAELDFYCEHIKEEKLKIQFGSVQ